MARVYLRKAEMVGDYFDCFGTQGGCPLYRALTRLFPDSKIIVGGVTVEIDDKYYRIVTWKKLADLRYIPVNQRKPMKVTIKGLTIPR